MNNACVDLPEYVLAEMNSQIPRLSLFILKSMGGKAIQPSAESGCILTYQWSYTVFSLKKWRGFVKATFDFVSVTFAI